MFAWLRTRLRAWAQRVQEKQIARLLMENRELKALLRDNNGGRSLRLTADERRRLDALRRKIDPEA